MSENKNANIVIKIVPVEVQIKVIIEAKKYLVESVDVMIKALNEVKENIIWSLSIPLAC